MLQAAFGHSIRRARRLRFEPLEDRTLLAILTGPGAGRGPLVRAFDAMDNAVRDVVSAYDSPFTAGVRIAGADFDGDGIDEIVTGPGKGSAPEVRIFDAQTGTLLRSFFAYAPAFTGGVNVATGDVDGDGTPDIITGPGAGGGPQVRVFSGVDGARLHSFFGYSRTFFGGVTVAAGDVDGDGLADIITGPGPGMGPQVKVFSGEDALGDLQV